MNVSFLLQSLQVGLRPDDRPFCRLTGVRELLDAPTQEAFLRAMYQCGIDVTVITKNQAPKMVPLTIEQWVWFVEPKVMPQLQFADEVDYDLRQRCENGPTIERPHWLSDSVIKILCALLQCNLLGTLQFGLIQASVQLRLLSTLQSTHPGKDVIKGKLRDFFQKHFDDILLMSQYALQGCAAVILSKGSAKTKSHLGVEPSRAYLAQGSALSQAVQIGTTLTKKITPKADPLFTLKELGALTEANINQLDSAFNRGAKLFYTLSKENMEPSSRMARCEHALERVGDQPQSNPAWSFFKASVF